MELFQQAVGQQRDANPTFARRRGGIRLPVRISLHLILGATRLAVETGAVRLRFQNSLIHSSTRSGSSSRFPKTSLVQCALGTTRDFSFALRLKVHDPLPDLTGSLPIGSRAIKETATAENVRLFGLFRCGFHNARTNKGGAIRPRLSQWHPLLVYALRRAVRSRRETDQPVQQ